MKLQTIEINGAPCAIVPIRDYDQLRDALEDAADREALRQSRASGEELVPDEFVDRLGGGSPVRVWREYRGLTATALARRAKGVQRPVVRDRKRRRHRIRADVTRHRRCPRRDGG